MNDLLRLLSVVNEKWHNILGSDRDSVKVFRIWRNVIPLIYGVYTCDSCTHIFMEYRILSVT